MPHSPHVPLRAVRLSRGLTQEELAARVGVEQPTISRLETHELVEPRWVLVFRLAKVLRVKPEHLFPVEWPLDGTSKGAA